MQRIRTFGHYCRVSFSFPVLLVLSACGGGGGPGSSDSSSASAPLDWYLILDPVTTVGSDVVARSDLLRFQPDTDVNEILDTLTGLPAAVDGFERISDTEFYFSPAHHADLSGTVVAPGDIVQSSNGSLSIVFDASELGIASGVNVDAVSMASNGDLIFSTDIHFSIGGETYNDADLIRFDGTNFSLLLGDAELGLDDAADVDGLTMRGSAELSFSLSTGGSANGLTYTSGDVLLATTSSGVVSVALDTSNRLSTESNVVALSDNR